jgi:two-component system cell cycle response regulator CtrA
MRMLLVEDDRTFSRGMVAMLGKSGIQVEVADSGEEALERAGLASFDLVLLDLMLPDMDGHEVLRRLRAAQVETPVMVLSGLTGPQARVKAFHLGGDEFLAKPFDREELLARIHAVVRRQRAAAACSSGVRLFSVTSDGTNPTRVDPIVGGI